MMDVPMKTGVLNDGFTAQGEIIGEPPVEKTKFVVQPKRHERRKNIGQRRRNGEVIARLPGSRVPFKHAMALMDQMAIVIHKGLNPVDRQIELAALPPYTSRGHSKSRGRAAKATRAAVRVAAKGFGPKGQPHTYTMA